MNERVGNKQSWSLYALLFIDVFWNGKEDWEYLPLQYCDSVLHSKETNNYPEASIAHVSYSLSYSMSASNWSDSLPKKCTCTTIKSKHQEQLLRTRGWQKSIVWIFYWVTIEHCTVHVARPLTFETWYCLCTSIEQLHCPLEKDQ